jgi:hypothetical protein
LLGVLSLISLFAYYSILSTNMPLAQTVYEQLNNYAPGYFASASQALRSVAYGTLGEFFDFISFRLGVPLLRGGFPP